MTHAVLTNNDDDDIDFDEGYQGNIQYALIIKNQTPGAVPAVPTSPRYRAELLDSDYTPQTAGVLANVTVIGGDAANSKGEFVRCAAGHCCNPQLCSFRLRCNLRPNRRSDDDGDSNTPKIDTPITLNNFLCDTVVLPLTRNCFAGSTVTEEGISFDENLAIVNSSAMLGAPTDIAATITAGLL